MKGASLLTSESYDEGLLAEIGTGLGFSALRTRSFWGDSGDELLYVCPLYAELYLFGWWLLNERLECYELVLACDRLRLLRTGFKIFP